jgi:hypothetical protein
MRLLNACDKLQAARSMRWIALTPSLHAWLRPLHPRTRRHPLRKRAAPPRYGVTLSAFPALERIHWQRLQWRDGACSGECCRCCSKSSSLPKDYTRRHAWVSLANAASRLACSRRLDRTPHSRRMGHALKSFASAAAKPHH